MCIRDSGIPDRYDNDFRSSNYFESIYDVDGLKKDDKESTLGKLEKYKSKVCLLYTSRCV